MKKRGFSGASLLSEAWRNVASGTSRALLLSAVMALLVVALSAIENSAVQSLDAKATLFVRSGASTYRISSPNNVDGGSCEQLARSGIVDRAGALRKGSSVKIRSLPDAPLQVYEVSPQFLSFLNVAPIEKPGVLISQGLANDILPNDLAGPAASRKVSPLSVVGVYQWPDDGRSADLQYAVVAPVAKTTRYDECWIRSTDPAQKPLDLLQSTLVRPPDDPSEAVPVQLNQRLGEAFTMRSEFSSRGTRYAWGFAFLASALIAVAAFRRRAAEFANAKECQVPTGSILTGCALEAGFYAIVGSILALSGLFLHMCLKGLNMWHIMPFDMRIACGAVSGALLGSIVGVAVILRRPVEHYIRIR
jgi:hypothetical protein